MKKAYRFIALTLLAAFLSGFVPAAARAAQDYDPMNTMLALNMAIVSVNRIVSTQDRAVLDQEYNRIISQLALGNIESDQEMTGLYRRLMSVITNKGLRQEEARRIRESYDRAERQQVKEALRKIRADGDSLLEACANLAVSCVSSYLDYQDSADRLREGLDGQLWPLTQEEIKECDELQSQLLESTWSLLRQYNLPDASRLDRDNIKHFFQALQEPKADVRFRLLRRLEERFRDYPPYWVYRVRAARESGDAGDVQRGLEEFDKTWRPVLREDPYKVEAAKFRVLQYFSKAGTLTEQEKQEIRPQLDTIQKYMPPDDWANNLFLSVAHYALGEREKAIDCVTANIGLKTETELSGVLLEQLKAGKVDLSALLPSGDVRGPAPEPAQRQTAETPQEHPGGAGQEKRGSSYSHYLIAGVALLATLGALAYLSAVRKRREQERRKREEEAKREREEQEQREREEQARREREEQEQREREEREQREREEQARREQEEKEQREREEQERQEREEKIKRKVKKLNSAFSGECLGDVFTAEQSAAIRAGTFDGMALGDYWTINGVNWRIADFDYLIRSDKAEVDASKHHVMIVPDKILYEHAMNSLDTAVGGYADSEMRASGLNQAKDIVEKAFGRDHILTYRGYINTGKDTGEWADCSIELMTEEMVGGEDYEDEGDNVVSLARVSSDFIDVYEDGYCDYWLQDVHSAACFASVSYDGNASDFAASYVGGVRPAFALY